MNVYNLSVDQDESYVIPCAIVHNCRCSVVQVRRSKYPESDLAEAMKRGAQATESKYSAMFQFNPGKQMTCFPAYNAYTRRACASCDGKGDSRNELCRVCAVARSLKSRV